MVYLDQILHTYLFQHCPATGMQSGDEALPTFIKAYRGILMKIPTTISPHFKF